MQLKNQWPDQWTSQTLKVHQCWWPPLPTQIPRTAGSPAFLLPYLVMVMLFPQSWTQAFANPLPPILLKTLLALSRATAFPTQCWEDATFEFSYGGNGSPLILPLPFPSLASITQLGGHCPEHSLEMTASQKGWQDLCLRGINHQAMKERPIFNFYVGKILKTRKNSNAKRTIRATSNMNLECKRVQFKLRIRST